jgi:hypothetical protein
MVAALTGKPALGKLQFDAAAARADLEADASAPLSALSRNLLLDLLEAFGQSWRWMTEDYTKDDIDAALSAVQRELMQEATGGGAMQLIAAVTLDEDTATITLEDIPQDYAHLWLFASLRTNWSGQVVDYPLFWLNGDDSDNHYYYNAAGYRYGNFNAVAPGSSLHEDAAQLYAAASANSAPSDLFIPSQMFIHRYAEAGIYHLIDQQHTEHYADGVAYAIRDYVKYTQKDAITSLSLSAGSPNVFRTGSQVKLYGLE